MGIKDLGSLIPPHLYETIAIKLLQGHKISIDTSIYIHKFISGAYGDILESSSKELEEPDDELVYARFFFLFYKLTASFIFQSIIPIYVIDGTPPESKADERERRRDEGKKKKQRAKSLIKEARQQKKENGKVDNKLLKQMKSAMIATAASLINDEIKKQLYKFLTALGVPIVVAPEEAEQMCAYLVRKRYASAALTTDTDVLAHGCPIMITKLGGRGQYYTEMTIIMYENLLTHLNLSQESFLDLCIMLGTDHNKRVRGFGVVKCIDIINDYERIEHIPELVYDYRTKKYVAYNKCDLGDIDDLYARFGHGTCDVREIDLYLGDINLKYIDRRLKTYDIHPSYHNRHNKIKEKGLEYYIFL